jgi:hypothetical protein
MRERRSPGLNLPMGDAVYPVMGRDVDGTVAGRRRQRQMCGWPQLALRVTGAGLLAASASIHLDLYLTGYRSIPTIGWLFLLQVIAGFVLAAVVLATRSRLAAAAGAAFALSTLGGYLLSVWIGLFGFKEIRTTAGIAAGLIEVAAFAALALAAVTAGPVRQADEPASPVAVTLARVQAAAPMLIAAVRCGLGARPGPARRRRGRRRTPARGRSRRSGSRGHLEGHQDRRRHRAH